MEGETQSTAAAAPVATEAQPTTNTAPVEAPAQAPAAAPAQAVQTAAQPAQTADPNAWLQGAPEEFRRFVESNGYEKAFEKFKQSVSAPQAQIQTQPTQAQPAQAQTTQTQSAQPQPMAQQPKGNGVLTQQEISMKLYFDSIAAQPQYANIADDIRSGEIFNQMTNLGMSPFEMDGSVNTTRLGSFLDMYSKTRPAVTPAVPEMSNPATANYTSIGENGVTSREEAFRIMTEQGNPNREAAIKYLREDYKNIRKSIR